MKQSRTFTLFCLLLSIPIATYNTTLFYRPTHFFNEPRIDHDWLTSLQVHVGGGSTNESRNCNGDTVALFDLHGLHNMHQLGVGIPNKNFENENDIILTQLANTPTRDTFAHFSVCGEFRIIESYIALTQNFCNGFFLESTIPIRHLETKNIMIRDVSPGAPAACHADTNSCPNINTPIWQTFLQSFDSIMKQHNLCLDPCKETDIGDLSVLLGWTRNYQGHTTLDYIDTTIKAGFLAPTSPDNSITKPFCVPFGYNGHWAFPLGIDVALGICEWMTFGTHLDALIFFDKTCPTRMKTSVGQNGLIKLACGQAKQKRGMLWNASGYFKADHIARGFSFLLGYTYSKQQKTILEPCNTTIFFPAIVNSDCMLAGWHMHTLHFALEYDFTQCDWCVGPHVGIFYNHHLNGERVFQTYFVGGTVGVDISWNF